MSLQWKVFIGFGVVVLSVIAYVAWASMTWQYQTIAGRAVREHGLTGIVQQQIDGQWQAPFVTDPQAPVLTEADLATARIEGGTGQWGTGGLLVGNVVTAPGKPLRGRLVFVVKITETSDGKVIRDRSLPQTVDWPGGTTIPFVLPTQLHPPIRNQKTLLALGVLR